MSSGAGWKSASAFRSPQFYKHRFSETRRPTIGCTRPRFVRRANGGALGLQSTYPLPWGMLRQRNGDSDDSLGN